MVGEREVEQIKELYHKPGSDGKFLSIEKIAAKFGVCKTTISSLVKKEGWPSRKEIRDSAKYDRRDEKEDKQEKDLVIEEEKDEVKVEVNDDLIPKEKGPLIEEATKPVSEEAEPFGEDPSSSSGLDMCEVEIEGGDEIISKKEVEEREKMQEFIEKNDHPELPECFAEELMKDVQKTAKKSLKSDAEKKPKDLHKLEAFDESRLSDEDKEKRRKLICKVKRYVNEFESELSDNFIGKTMKERESFWNKVNSYGIKEIEQLLKEFDSVICAGTTHDSLRNGLYTVCKSVEKVGESIFELQLKNYADTVLAYPHTNKLLKVLEVKYSDMLENYLAPEAQLFGTCAMLIFTVDSANRRKEEIDKFGKTEVPPEVQKRFVDL